MAVPLAIPARALAVALGLAVALTPATAGLGATKAPATRTVKGCVLKKKAKCKKAKLTKAKVGKVNLTGTTLAGATITGATFTGTDLTRVNLTGARITNTTFTNVTVTGLDLSRARLQNVKFVGARAAVQSAQARESACTADQASQEQPGYEGSTVYTCTPGGVTMRGARVVPTGKSGFWAVAFVKSSIERSDFRDIAAIDSQGTPLIGFLQGTDVSSSWFGPARAHGDAVFEFQKAVVQESVMDGVALSAMNDTNASRSSMLGARVVGGGSLTRGGNTLTGVRGLAGSSAVTITGPDGVSPPGLRSVQIREDGVFRPGVICTQLPCARSAVAVNAPVIATVAGTEPLVLSLEGWSCAAGDAAEVGGVTVYRSTCSIDRFPAGNVSGVVAATRVQLVPVVVTADTGVPATETAVSRLSLVVTPPGGDAPETTTCTSSPTCTRLVIPGSSVSVRASDGARVMYAQCPGASDVRLAAANVELVCPPRAVPGEGLTARVIARPGMAMTLRVVDTFNTSVRTPLATLRWSVQPPGLTATATINCDGTSACDVSFPSAAVVQLSLGDPVLGTSGFCPGPPTQFFFRPAGEVSSCPAYTVTGPEVFEVQSEP